jgi:hypothetical protein
MIRADFKNNEQAVFKRLAKLEQKKPGNTGEAAENADAVRYWVS